MGVDEAAVLYCWWRTGAGELDEEAARPGGDGSAGLPATAPRVRVLREMDRLALLGAESLDDARRRLLGYRAGDLWLPTGGVSRQKMQIPDLISILVVGPERSGKSSLVNLMYSVLGRSALVPFAHTSPSGSGKGGRTRCLEEHNVLRSHQSGFCVFDTCGFEYDSMHQGLRDMAHWVKCGVHHRQICHGACLPYESSMGMDRNYARRRVNFIVVVANMSEIYRAFKGSDMRPLEASREIFSAASDLMSYEEPILVLTHGDELSREERLEARLRICNHLGVSETTGAYDITCLNEYGILVEECDPATAYGVVEVVYRALLASDQNHPLKKSILDWLLAMLYWIMGCLANFFAFLSKFFSQYANKDHKLKFD